MGCLIVLSSFVKSCMILIRNIVSVRVRVCDREKEHFQLESFHFEKFQLRLEHCTTTGINRND